jgi:hypothetical protein
MLVQEPGNFSGLAVCAAEIWDFLLEVRGPVKKAMKNKRNQKSFNQNYDPT